MTLASAPTLKALDGAPQVDMVALRRKAQGDLYFFSKGVLNYDWIVPHIHMDICRDLVNPDYSRKLIVLPRGWLKTTLCSICYPMWLSINDENIRILLVQNSMINACKKLKVIRYQWEQNSLLRALFPELLPGRTSIWQSESLCLTRSAPHPESTYEAAGTGVKIVSRHYDVVIEDDTVAPDVDELGIESSLAPTHGDVEKAIGWHRTNVMPLLNDPSSGKVLVVGTRWYDQDLIQWIKDNEPNYHVMTRACREDPETGKPDPKGEITYEERFPPKTLEELEHALGAYMFSCLYMNTPVRSEDMMFKQSWFRYYDVEPSRAAMQVYTTVDPATDPSLSKSSDLDYSVVMTTGKDLISGKIYVLDYFRERCDPGSLSSAIFNHVVKWKPIVVGYEAVGFQKSLDYWLKNLMRQESVYFILEPLTRGGKDAKLHAISGLQPLFNSNTIYFRAWMKALESELLKFPLGKHDDLPDALAMHLQLWKYDKKSKVKEAPDPTDDPLSLEGALINLRARHTSHRHDCSPVFQPLNTAPGVLDFVGRS